MCRLKGRTRRLRAFMRVWAGGLGLGKCDRRPGGERTPAPQRPYVVWQAEANVMNALLSPLGLLGRHRVLMPETTRNDFRARYARSAAGFGIGPATSSATLIKNTLFPIEPIPFKAVSTSRCTRIAGIGVLMGRWPMHGVFSALPALPVATFSVAYWLSGRMKKVFVDNV